MLPGTENKIEDSFCYWMVPACYLSNRSGTQYSWPRPVPLCLSQNFILMKWGCSCSPELEVKQFLRILFICWKSHGGGTGLTATLRSARVAAARDMRRCSGEVWGSLTLRDGASPFWSQAGFSLHAPNQLSNVNLFSLNYLHGWSEQQKIRVLSKCSLMLKNEWLLTLKRSSVAGSYLESCLISHKLSKLIRWGAENI